MSQVTLRPVHRSAFVVEHFLDPETRFNPDGHEIWDRNGRLLSAGFDVETVDGEGGNPQRGDSDTARPAGKKVYGLPNAGARR